MVDLLFLFSEINHFFLLLINFTLFCSYFQEKQSVINNENA